MVKMKLYNSFNIKKNHKNSIILIGNFDGFHLGHQKVIKTGKNLAKKNKLKFGLLVFHPLPVMFFNKKINSFRIDTLKQKIENSKKLGIDFIIIKKFDKNFSKTIAIDPAQNSLLLPLSTIKSGFVQTIFFSKFFSNKSL